MNKFLLLLLLIGFRTIYSQIPLKDFDAKTIGYFNNQVFYSNTGQALYNFQGQIVFSDTSKNKKDIVLTVEILKKKIRINEGIETRAKWLIQNEVIYFRNNQEDIEIIKYQIKDGFTSFYDSNTDSLVAFLPSESLSKMELSLAFTYIWNYYELEKKTSTLSVNLQSVTELPEGVLGFMKPVFGDPLLVWVWDGELLYPAYDNDPFYIWTNDGSTIKPLYNSRIETEWSWDGEEIRPYWGGHPRNNWRWENNILRQVFENNYKNEYEYVDGIVRKRFGSFNDIEWEIHGEMPLSLISIVVLGIVNRR